MTNISDNSSADVKASVRFITVDAERAGQRIDNFLMNLLKGAPKSLIYRIVRKGEVRVNKGRVKVSYHLQAGDVVRVPPVRLAEREVERPGRSLIERLDKSIIYEDDGIIVLNKPSGVAVHGGSGVNYGVIEAMRALRPKQTSLELVHRLDRDTSGCLILAKKRSALRRLHELLRNGEVDKRYLALLQGAWCGGVRMVDAPLRKNTLRSGERVVRVSADGKQARSRFIPRTPLCGATLMEIELFTGRTHQIRVHASHSGHPIAGDDKYGDSDFNKEMKKVGLSRLFLHAYRLRFPWSEEGDLLEISAPLDEKLESVLVRLAK